MKPTPSDRVKATKLRTKIRVGHELAPADAEWLNNYETERDAVKEQSKGASRAHKVSYTEESAEAVGTGSAAEVAALAAVAREEGRQLDKVVSVALNALTAACDLHRKMSEALLARAVEDGKTMRELMISVRTHYLDAAELEADAIRKSAEEKDDNSSDNMVNALLPLLAAKMGIALPTASKKVKTRG